MAPFCFINDQKKRVFLKALHVSLNAILGGKGTGIRGVYFGTRELDRQTKNHKATFYGVVFRDGTGAF